MHALFSRVWVELRWKPVGFCWKPTQPAVLRSSMNLLCRLDTATSLCILNPFRWMGAQDLHGTYTYWLHCSHDYMATWSLPAAGDGDITCYEHWSNSIFGTPKQVQLLVINFQAWGSMKTTLHNCIYKSCSCLRVWHVFSNHCWKLKCDKCKTFCGNGEDVGMHGSGATISTQTRDSNE